MYKFITSFVALSVCLLTRTVLGVGDGYSLGVTSIGTGTQVFGATTSDMTVDWVGTKPTDTDEYKQSGIHVYNDESMMGYETVCEQGGGVYVSKGGESTMGACLNPYKQWLPNPDNTKRQNLRIDVSNTTPDVLLAIGDRRKFSENYIETFQTQCAKIAMQFERRGGTTIICGCAAAAMGGSCSNVDGSEYTNDFLDNVDPTEMDGYKTDGIYELIEQGRRVDFEQKCERGGGKFVWTDEEVEPFAIACINPNAGQWLPNPGNMSDGSHSVTYNESVPYVLRNNLGRDVFEELYGTHFSERCQELGGYSQSLNGGARFLCVGSLGDMGDTPASADHTKLIEQQMPKSTSAVAASVDPESALMSGQSGIGGQPLMLGQLNGAGQIQAVEEQFAQDGCTDLGRVGDMPPAEFFEKCIASLSEIARLQEKYEAAHRNEIRLENRLLGGLTMAATGAGGMMLAMGLAEQRADKQAEDQMRAYVSTFKCNYGNTNVEYGTAPTELPMSTELYNLYAEYVALANDLKMRKESLGLRAGIESEAILDSATTGLYDDVSSGRSAGMYTSLARAILDPEGEDAKKWDEQAKKSKNLVISGATVGGVGAVGGAVGNMLINKDAYGLGSGSEQGAD